MKIRNLEKMSTVIVKKIMLKMVVNSSFIRIYYQNLPGIMSVVPAELRVAKKSNIVCIALGHWSGSPPAKLTICKKLTEERKNVSNEMKEKICTRWNIKN